MERLKNKVAIITGAATGIGRGIALRFHEEGAKIAILDINMDGMKETMKLMGAKEKDVLLIKGDIRVLSEIKAFVKQVGTTFGTIDILVNNAGTCHDMSKGGVLSTTNDAWDDTIAVDLTGPFRLIQEVVPYMIKQNKGKIVNIASTAAIRAVSGQTAYTAAKGGLLTLGMMLADELGEHQININTICPGSIVTPLITALAFKDEVLKKQWESNQPMGRLGQPLDIANCALFLASEESDYISGVSISVDGGWVVRPEGSHEIKASQEKERQAAAAKA